MIAVVPAKAGIRAGLVFGTGSVWIPAFAGMMVLGFQANAGVIR